MADNNQTENSQDEQGNQAPSFFAVMISTFAAAFGVQSDKNRKRDFQHGNIRTFILAGVVFTTCLVLSVVLLVNWVLA